MAIIILGQCDFHQSPYVAIAADWLRVSVIFTNYTIELVLQQSQFKSLPKQHEERSLFIAGEFDDSVA
jgi:hypothetical protein